MRNVWMMRNVRNVRMKKVLTRKVWMRKVWKVLMTILGRRVLRMTMKMAKRVTMAQKRMTTIAKRIKKMMMIKMMAMMIWMRTRTQGRTMLLLHLP